MRELERRRMVPVRAVDWRTYREAAQERFRAEMRVQTGADLTERAHEGLCRVRDRLAARGGVDDIDVLLLQSYAFGAAEIIHDFMQGS